MSRAEHGFHFEALEIAKAARSEASYHRERETYWRAEFDAAVLTVEQTIGAKAQRHAEEAELYESDASVYGSQARSYELSRADVQYFRLGAAARDVETDEEE